MPSVDDETLTRHIRTLLQDIDWTDLGAVQISAKRLSVTPDQGVGITVYGSTDDPQLLTRRVQFWCRGKPDDPFGPDRLAHRLYEHLHWRHHDSLIARARRLSTAQLGLDGNGRDERTDNYEIILTP